GFIHALFFLPLIFQNENGHFNAVADPGKLLPSIKSVVQIGSTFLIVLVAWVFFIADDVTHAFLYLQEMFSVSLFSFPMVSKGLVLFLMVYMIFEWLQREKKHLLEIDFITSKPIRITIYYTLVFAIFYFAGDTQPFIYFQ